MGLILRSRVFWSGFALLALFFVAAWLIPNNQLVENLRILQIAAGMVVVTAYLPYAFDGIKAGRPDRVQQLSMGIALGFMSVICAGLWSLIWRLSGQPRWMVSSDVNSFFVWMSILAATLHITAPGAIDGIVPKRNWIMLGLAFGAGFLCASLILLFHPDFQAVAEWLRPIFAPDDA
ncbi:MAG TPA: hypothetical protein VGU45_05060 [Microvirga sp.]|nr:hypothetical protein [Microvirga sp.]